MDWGVGTYERTAKVLEPASVAAIEALGLRAGDRVLDVACGTGNAALTAAQRGGRVVGLDGSKRLLDVAAERAAAAGLSELEWVVGDMAQLPFDDDAFEAAVSVFGAIFAADARAVADELLRVVRPGGRIAITTWTSRGPIAEMMRLTRQAVVDALPEQPSGVGTNHLDWGDPGTLRELLGPDVEVSELTLPFTAASPRAWIDEQDAHHPSWAATRALVPPDRYAELLEELTDVLAAGNEDPDAFLVNGQYLLVRAVVPA